MTRLWGRLRTGLREPLARFLLLGLAIFAADRLLTGGDAASRGSRIVVTASQQDALRAAFLAEHGRAPDAAELRARLDRWLDEEVLYREALALGLDRRDAIVRRQLTQKMRFLIEDGGVPPEPAPAELQAWLDRYPERYGKPRTVSFDQVFLSRGRHGAGLAQAAAQAAVRLGQAPDDFVGLGDPFLVGQVVSQADAGQLRRDFGADFAAALEQAPDGRWSGPLASSFGLHLVRVTARGAFRPARLEEVLERVRQDYRLAQRERRNRAALDRLRARYRIEFGSGAGGPEAG
ncbi:MAG: peptidyl-prolyl cis-trans isomerase [Gammaproteobacteria bacterium]|nr:peptidyl-prolyl cis-trans isomerase [Gammaproteobacteria bacterium]